VKQASKNGVSVLAYRVSWDGGMRYILSHSILEKDTVQFSNL
jgi:hypothetical protein